MCWSRRASDQFAEIRHEFAWLEADRTTVLRGRSGEPEWWTFAGSRGNATLASTLSDCTGTRVEHDGFTLTFEARLTLDEVQRAINEVRLRDIVSLRPRVDEGAIAGLKFAECLPAELAVEMLERRLVDIESTEKTLRQSERYVAKAPS